MIKDDDDDEDAAGDPVKTRLVPGSAGSDRFQFSRAS